MKTEEIKRQYLKAFGIDSENELCVPNDLTVQEIISFVELCLELNKSTLPITEEEITEIIFQYAFPQREHYRSEENYKASKFTHSKHISILLKDRLQSDAIVFGEFLNEKCIKSGYVWIMPMDLSKTFTEQDLYNSEEFKNYKNNLNK